MTGKTRIKWHFSKKTNRKSKKKFKIRNFKQSKGCKK